MKLEVTDIQRGCTHDGPGLRTTVFLKGCPLHCRWCHNPETQEKGKELFYRPEKCIGCMACAERCPQKCHIAEDGIHLFDPANCIRCMACAECCPTGALETASKTMELAEVVEQVLLDRIFYRRRGGLTVSGGEPTVQKEGLLALLSAIKEQDISTCLETCGVFPKSLVAQLLPLVDLFLYDVKDTDDTRLRENTGASLAQVTENLLAIDRGGGKTVMRCILIPDVNLNPAHAEGLAKLYRQLHNCQFVELLPYHPYGLSKTEQLGKAGIRYRQPEKQELADFAQFLKEQDIPVKLYGSLV